MRSLAIFLLALLAAPALGFNLGIVAQARVVAPRTSPLLLQSEPPAAAADAAAVAVAQAPSADAEKPALPACDYPGCNDTGRILGGLAATTLFAWWPIKVRSHINRATEMGVSTRSKKAHTSPFPPSRPTARAPSALRTGGSTRVVARRSTRSSSRRIQRADTTVKMRIRIN